MAKFVSNPLFKGEMQLDPEFQEGMSGIASRATREVKAVAETFANTGDYAESLSSPGPYIVTSDPFWHLIEFGSVNNPPYAPLRRGIAAAGLRLDIRQL